MLPCLHHDSWASRLHRGTLGEFCRGGGGGGGATGERDSIDFQSVELNDCCFFFSPLPFKSDELLLALIVLVAVLAVCHTTGSFYFYFFSFTITEPLPVQRAAISRVPACGAWGFRLSVRVSSPRDPSACPHEKSRDPPFRAGGRFYFDRRNVHVFNLAPSFISGRGVVEVGGSGSYPLTKWRGRYLLREGSTSH